MAGATASSTDLARSTPTTSRAPPSANSRLPYAVPQPASSTVRPFAARAAHMYRDTCSTSMRRPRSWSGANRSEIPSLTPAKSISTGDSVPTHWDSTDRCLVASPGVPDVAFVMSPRQDYPLRELVATLEYELGLQGLPAALHLGAFPEVRPNRVYVLMGPREYVALEGEQALPEDAVLKRTIFIGAEDPDTIGGDQSSLELMRRAGAVFDLNQRTVLALQRRGIPARTLKLGHSALLDRFDAEAPRPIDVMFYGRHSARRGHHLGRWADVLA